MAMTARFRLPRLAVLAVCSLLPAVGHSQEVTHRISFTFDYDFRITPACPQAGKNPCVLQFNFYDISHGIANRVKLGSVPVPVGASGLVKGISGTSDALLFNSGRHMVAVSAQLRDGSESDLSQCATIVKIP